MKKLTIAVISSLFIFVQALSAQDGAGVLHGVIKDAQGYGIPGAAVIPTGTTAGAVADFDGKFSVNIPAGSRSVEISCLGYDSRTVILSGQDNITVVLDESAMSLDATVVVGYGTQKKSDLTGALSVVDSKELENRSAMDVGHMLQGVVPGLTVTSDTGRPGATADLNIRGVNSINGGSPLVLIDGVEGDLQRLNSQDVESISVIKDAAAAAIYGARASYGVILVTTKSGSKGDGKPVVHYSGRAGFTAPTTSTDFETRGYYSVLTCNTFWYPYTGAKYINYNDAQMEELYIRRNDVTENPRRPWTVITHENGRDVYNYYANTDWYHELFNDIKPNQSHSISLSGGTEYIQYMFSGGYNREEGMFKVNPDVYDKYNFRGKIAAKPFKWLTISDNASYFSSKFTYPGQSNIEANFEHVVIHGLACFPTTNPDGSNIHKLREEVMSYTVFDDYQSQLWNPNNHNIEKKDQFSNTVELSLNPVKQLEVKANYTYTFYTSATTNRWTKFSYSEDPGIIVTSPSPDYLTEKNSQTRYHALNAYATYTDTFADAHNLKLMLGYNYEQKHIKDVTAKGYNLLVDSLYDLSLVGGDASGTKQMEVKGGQNQYAIMGFFGRLNYDYKGKYLLELAGRYDGTSRFAKASRWGFFPSGSVGWKISEEKFFEPIKKTVNLLKLRYSYGQLGNQQVGYYDYIREVSVGTQSYLLGGNKPSSASIDSPVSGDLTWETVAQHNLGLDIALLNNRLTFTGEAYIRDTKNMLTYGMTLPAVYGASEPKMNCANLRTKGYELTIGWRDQFDIAGHPFEYNASVNFYDYLSRVTKYDNPTKLLSDYYEGMVFGEIWGCQVDGFFKTDAEAAAYPVDQSYVNQRIGKSAGEFNHLRAGDLKYIDRDGDGKITFGSRTVGDPGDRYIIGNSSPRYQYGINLGFKYYGFDFSMFMQGVGQQQWYPCGDCRAFWGPFARAYENFVPKNFLDDCWSETNPNAYFPRPRSYAAYGNTETDEWAELSTPNDKYLQNLAYCRLKNLVVGYTLPSKVLDKIKLHQIRVYFTGENLAYICPGLHSKIIDPERAGATASESNGGKMYIYPWQKSFMFGIDITF